MENLSSSLRKSYTMELITSPNSLVLSSCICIAAITIVPIHIDKSAILGEKKKKTEGKEKKPKHYSLS